MANFIFNASLARIAEFGDNVIGNTPANSALVIVVIDTSATDVVLKDMDNLSLVLGDVNTAEVTNTNYARKELTDASGITVTVTDNPTNNVVIDFPDQTWSAVAAGDGWTDLLVCYDPDVTAGVDDTRLIPLSQHDFVATPDGNDITAQTGAGGFVTAT